MLLAILTLHVTRYLIQNFSNEEALTRTTWLVTNLARRSIFYSCILRSMNVRIQSISTILREVDPLSQAANRLQRTSLEHSSVIILAFNHF
jgi:hypothetical protein